MTFTFSLTSTMNGGDNFKVEMPFEFELKY